MNIGLGAKRRTILLVDSDPHARAVLRNALEAAGFSVGEAPSDAEGERTALRIQPDIILADLHLGASDTHDGIAERLLRHHSKIPVYIVSTAAEALIGSVGLDELGIAGVFLKPVDPAIVVQTLRIRLSAV